MATVRDLRFKNRNTTDAPRELVWVTPKNARNSISDDMDVRVTLLSATDAHQNRRIAITFYHDMHTIFDGDRIAIAYSYGRIYFKEDTDGYKITHCKKTTPAVQITSKVLVDIFEQKQKSGHNLQYVIMHDEELNLYYIDLN